MFGLRKQTNKPHQNKNKNEKKNAMCSKTKVVQNRNLSWFGQSRFPAPK